MRVNVVGIKSGIKGVNKNTGREYSGTTVYYNYVTASVEGMCAESIYVSDHIMRNCEPFRVGDEVDIYFNRYGKCDTIRVVD